MRWLKTREDFEKALERDEYARRLWCSKSVWNKLEALWQLEIAGYAFANELLCQLLREIGEKACEKT